jgi:hypothetical protein
MIMGADGALVSGLRGDPAKAEAIRTSLDFTNPNAATSLGQDIQARLAACLEQVAQAAPGHDLEQAAALIRRLRNRIERADLAMVAPRRGLVGLFDNGRDRLESFRDAFNDVVREAGETQRDLASRQPGLDRRQARLDALHQELSGLIAELDAWIAGLAQGIAQHQPHNPSADQPLSALIDEVASATEETGSPARDLMTRRLGELRSLRDGAVARLALIRVCQNAESNISALAARATRALAEWQADWGRHLGLDGAKARRTRPDTTAMDTARSASATALKGVEDALEQSGVRRAVAAERIARL